VRVRLFVWFSVSEFLLVVHYVDYKLETDSSSGVLPLLVHPREFAGLLQFFLDKVFLLWFSECRGWI